MSKKPDLEFNKLFAAVLVAGIMAMVSGFIAKKLVSPDFPAEAAIDIDTSALEVVSAGGDVKPKVADPIDGLFADADLARGEKLMRACAACHTFNNGGPNRVGPNLWGIVNKLKAKDSSFAYSDTLIAMGQKGQKWDYEALNQFLWKPKIYAPGTKMNYIGLKKPEDRAALIKWMNNQSSSPIALP